MKNDLLLQRSLMPIDREETGTDELIIERVRDINKLTAYGKCVQSNLPPKYTELEYVTFNGTQVLDTLYYPNQDTRIITKFLPSVNNCWLYGASPNNPRITLYSSSTGNSRFGNSVVDNLGFTADIEYNIIQDKNGIEINGVSNPYTTVDTNPFTTSYTLTIGNCNGSSSASYYYSGRFYYQRIYDNNILVRDYVPARRNSDNVLGMYDRVSGDFLVNQGTGSLIAGPDIVPIPGGRAIPDSYAELEYLESNGTQYIDTGITLSTTNTSIITDFQYTSNTGYNYLFGALGENGFIGFYNSTAGGNKLTITAGSGLQNITHLLNFDTNRHTLTINYGTSKYKIDSEQETNLSSTLNSTPTRSIYLFMRNYSSIGDYAYAKIYSWKLYESNVIVCDLVPARRKSDNVLGMFDLVSGNFLVNSGTGSFTAGPEIPSRPINIWCNNGVLKARHQSGLPLGCTLLEYIESTGTQYINTGINQVYQQKVSLEFSFTPTELLGYFGGNAYTQYQITASYGFAVNTNSVAKVIYDGTKSTLYRNDSIVSSVSWGANYSNLPIGLFALSTTSSTFVNQTKGKLYYAKIWNENDELVRDFVPAKRNSNNVIGMYDLVSGQFFTNAGTGDFTAGPVVSDPVEIYTSGPSEVIKINNNLTPPECSNLLGIEDYKDSQEVLGGNISRSVGIKVLDGTESGWTKSTSYPGAVYLSPSSSEWVTNTTIFCTHFNATTTASSSTYHQGDILINLGYLSLWYSNVNTQECVDITKQWLADQYAAGTPVIVVYPLATPTQETVEGQGINFEIGTNKVEAAQDDIDGLSFTVRYRQK